MLTDLNGAIAADSELGVFASDTRFVSHYAIFANGQPWRRLTSAATTYCAARIYLTNDPFATVNRAGFTWAVLHAHPRDRSPLNGHSLVIAARGDNRRSPTSLLCRRGQRGGFPRPGYQGRSIRPVTWLMAADIRAEALPQHQPAPVQARLERLVFHPKDRGRFFA